MLHLQRISVSDSSEPEKQKAFGKIIKDAEKKFTHSFVAAYLAAALIPNRDYVIPSGKDETGNVLPKTEGVLTKADAEALIEPLRELLNYSGYCLGTYTKSLPIHASFKPLSHSKNFTSGDPGNDFRKITNSLLQTMGVLHYSGFGVENFSEAKEQAIAAYKTGFSEAPSANTHPRINPGEPGAGGPAR